MRMLFSFVFMILASVGTASANTLWDLYPAEYKGAEGRFNGFAAWPYYQPGGGNPATLEQVVSDLEREETQIFRAEIARTEFIRTLLIWNEGEIADVAALTAALRDSARTRVVACEGSIETFGYNGSGSVKRHVRDCVAGEQLVEMKINGEWVAVFSLGCLNPLNGEIPSEVTDIFPDECSETWYVPEGSVTNGDSVRIFVPAEALKCMPPTLECDRFCEQWMWGQRGRHDDAKIQSALFAMAQGGGKAFILPAGVTEVRLPKRDTLSVDPAWCDREIHGSQEAHFMQF